MQPAMCIAWLELQVRQTEQHLSAHQHMSRLVSRVVSPLSLEALTICYQALPYHLDRPFELVFLDKSL